MLTLNMCILHELQVPHVSFLPSASTWIDTVLLLICAMHNWIRSSSFTSYCLTVLARTEELIFWTLSCFLFKIHGLSFWVNDSLHQTTSQGPSISGVQTRSRDQMLCRCSPWFLTANDWDHLVLPRAGHATVIFPSKSRLLLWQSGALHDRTRWSSLSSRRRSSKLYKQWAKPLSPFLPPYLILYHFLGTFPAFCSMLLI